jgi:hypothetical protein
MVIAGNCQAQDDLAKFGNCSMEEIQLKHCSFDSVAEGEVLFDVGKLYFDDMGYIVLERRIRIKVFTKAGLDQAEFSIPYLKGSQKINSLKGNTYNLENGKIVTTSLITKNAFEEQVADDWYQKKFAMPNVKEGSVFEISYTLLIPGIFNMPAWEFQCDIPVLFSMLDATIDPRYRYTHLLKGEKPLDDFQRTTVNTMPVFINKIPYSRENLKFIMRNVPAFKDESFITSSNDYIIKLNFQLAAYRKSDASWEPFLSTWPKLCEGLFESDYFGDYIKSCERAAKDIVTDNKLDTMSITNRCKWIDNYMKTNFEYNDIESFLSRQSCKQLLEKKSGSSADLNLMAVGFLRAAGIQADPVILSTRDHGKIQSAFPFIDAFNYAVALANIDSTLYIIDVTEPLLNFREVPIRCLNDEGMIVRKDRDEWIDFESTFMSDNRHEVELVLNPTLDSVSAQVKLTSTGYEALKKRKLFKTDYKKLAEDLMGKNYLSYDSITCANLTDTKQPFELYFSRPYEVEQVDGNLLIDPCCGMIITENPFMQPERSYPIDFTYKFSKTYSIKINIPKGYQVLSKPENFVVNNKKTRIVYTINSDDKSLTVIALYQFKNDVYPAEDYKELKQYYDNIISRFNQKIILQPTQI